MYVLLLVVDDDDDDDLKDEDGLARITSSMVVCISPTWVLDIGHRIKT